jgi:hypothetical protein
MEPQHIRRLRGGSIDFDFCRDKAASLRAQEMRDFFRRTNAVRNAILAVATFIVLAICAFAPAHRVYCPYCTADGGTTYDGGRNAVATNRAAITRIPGGRVADVEFSSRVSWVK